MFSAGKAKTCSADEPSRTQASCADIKTKCEGNASAKSSLYVEIGAEACTLCLQLNRKGARHSVLVAKESGKGNIRVPDR